MPFNGHPRHISVIRVIENVINEFDRRRKPYRSCFTNWCKFCQIPLCCYVLVWTSSNSGNCKTVYEIQQQIKESPEYH